MSCNWADEVLQHSFNIFRLSRRVLHTFFILRILIWIRIESITLPSQICRRGKLMAKNICFIRQWALQSFHLKCFCFKSQVEHHVLLLIHVDSDDTFVCVCVYQIQFLTCGLQAATVIRRRILQFMYELTYYSHCGQHTTVLKRFFA